ncbi:MAG: hypothetical protein O3B08_12045, partial [Proteobacteria bacterium]|nr:hypothetical protein [Pseudomonadota bacterium]
MAFAAGLEVTTPLWGYVLAGAIALLAFAVLLRRRKAEDDTIESAPVGLVWWARGNSGVTGPARELLGIESAADISVLANAFAADDTADVAGALQALRDKGEYLNGHYRTRVGK